jgi:hypothetical protein
MHIMEAAMAYEVLGYDYSGMGASARIVFEALAYGTWACSAAIAGVALAKAAKGGWRAGNSDGENRRRMHIANANQNTGFRI